MTVEERVRQSAVKRLVIDFGEDVGTREFPVGDASRIGVAGPMEERPTVDHEAWFSFVGIVDVRLEDDEPARKGKD